MDWVLIAAVLALSALGVLLVWSATGTRTYLEKQAVFAVIGLIVIFAVSAVDYRLRDYMERHNSGQASHVTPAPLVSLAQLADRRSRQAILVAYSH